MISRRQVLGTLTAAFPAIAAILPQAVKAERRDPGWFVIRSGGGVVVGGFTGSTLEEKELTFIRGRSFVVRDGANAGEPLTSPIYWNLGRNGRRHVFTTAGAFSGYFGSNFGYTAQDQDNPDHCVWDSTELGAIKKLVPDLFA